MIEKKYVTILAMVAVALAVATIGLGLKASDMAQSMAQIEAIPPCEDTLWSLTEGPYEYISDKTLALFDEIYAGRGAYQGIGQTQYKGLATICMMGTPKKPLDDSKREAWCVGWKYDAETDTWVAGEPYLWATMGDYKAWRVEVGLDR